MPLARPISEVIVTYDDGTTEAYRGRGNATVRSNDYRPGCRPPDEPQEWLELDVHLRLDES